MSCTQYVLYVLSYFPDCGDVLRRLTDVLKMAPNCSTLTLPEMRPAYYSMSGQDSRRSHGDLEQTL